MSTILIRRPRPFHNVAFTTNHATPDSGFNTGTTRNGYEWDGSTYEGGSATPPNDAFGPGTSHPIALNPEQLNRWYWALDEWQVAVAWDGGFMNLGAPDGAPASFSIGYGSIPNDDPVLGPARGDAAVPMRNRVLGRSPSISWVKLGMVLSGTFPMYFRMTFQMNLGDVLEQKATLLAPKMYYPAISFSIYPDPEDITGAPLHLEGAVGGNTVRTRFPPGAPTFQAIALGVDFTIDDQVVATPIAIPLFRDNADDYPTGGSEVPYALVTSAAAKPTGYLALSP